MSPLMYTFKNFEIVMKWKYRQLHEKILKKDLLMVFDARTGKRNDCHLNNVRIYDFFGIFITK